MATATGRLVIDASSKALQQRQFYGIKPTNASKRSVCTNTVLVVQGVAACAIECGRDERKNISQNKVGVVQQDQAEKQRKDMRPGITCDASTART